MSLPIIFANLPAGYSPLSFLDQNFSYLDARISGVAASSETITATSTTVLTIALGTQNLLVEEALRAWLPGGRLRLSSRANAGNFIEGTITAYAGNSLVLSADLIGGGGNFGDWDINLAGQPGLNGTGGDVFGPGASVLGNLPVFADATGKVLADSGLNPTSFAAAAAGVPTGGATGQVLTKTSAANYAVGWSSAGAGNVVGPAGATDGHIAVFDGATGEIIKDAGLSSATWLAVTGGGLSGGLNFGSAFASGPTDLSRHLALYSTTYGFSVINGQMSGNVAAGASFAWYVGGVGITSLGTAGLNLLGHPLLAAQLQHYSETLVAKGGVAVAATIDLSLGNVVSAQATGSVAWTFANPPGAGIAGSFTLYLTNGGLGTQTWPASVSWGAAGAPVLSSGSTDILVFETLNGGAKWYGQLVGTGF